MFLHESVCFVVWPILGNSERVALVWRDALLAEYIASLLVLKFVNKMLKCSFDALVFVHEEHSDLIHEYFEDLFVYYQRFLSLIAAANNR